MKRLAFTFFLLSLTLFFSCNPDTNNGHGNDIDTLSNGPVMGDWVRIYQSNDPDAIHPFASMTAGASFIMENVFQYLYYLNPETNQYEPCMIKDFATVSEDGLTYNFELLDEAKWDDGSPITGYDYEFSIKCIKNPMIDANYLTGYYIFIKDVHVNPDNPKKFSVQTKDPFFLAELALGGIELVQKTHYDPDDVMSKYSVAEMDSLYEKLADDPDIVAYSEVLNSEKYKRDPSFISGSGPYRVENWIEGDNVTLVRKENWWGDPFMATHQAFEAYPAKLIFKTFTDKAAAVKAANAGELDVVYDISPNEFIEIRDDKEGRIYKNYNFYTPETYAFTFIALNCRPPSTMDPLLENVKVRKALAHLTDVDKIIDVVYKGFGKRIIGQISPYNVNEYHTGLKPVEYDPEKAKKLLDEAGWIDSDHDGIRDKTIKGRKIDLDIEFMVSTSSETAPRLANIVAQDAEKAGVKIEVKRVDFREMGMRARNHNFQMFGGALTSNPIPSDLYQLWHSSQWVNNSSNYFGFGTPESDSLIEKIRTTIDVDERKKLYWKMQELIYDAQPAIFLIAPTERIIIHKRFENAHPYVVRPGFKARKFWVPVQNQMFGKNSKKK